MKVVLRKEIENLGEVDKVVEVSDGYVRNFLLPRGMAALATKAEVAAAAKRHAAREKALEERRSEFESLAAKLAGLTVEITADAGEEGRLFGSVTAQDIAQAILANAGIEVDKKKIELAAPIKIVGDYPAKIKIYKDISAQIEVKVSAAPKE
ncbi:MAG: 50S ribosomal protein L9 [Candidatus Margulisbacteria bacterium]|nr:50S ribosomal protein L9 [Candidatus Margulisiibacteriota bacterium]